jgi:hypothetical protein
MAATKPNFLSNLLPAIGNSVKNISVGGALLDAIPGAGQLLNKQLQSTGHALPTIGDAAQGPLLHLNKLAPVDYAKPLTKKMSNGKTNQENMQAQSDYMSTHVNFSGEMQELPGINPQNANTGTSLIKDAQGNFHINPKPQAPSYRQDTTAADALTSQAGNPQPQSNNASPAFPEKPQRTTVPAKKPFKLPGSFDPIDETQASKATQNSKAYSVTTPDIQDAYRRNGITDPNQVYQVKQNLYDQVINPTLQTDKTRLPLGELGKSDGIIPKIVKEMQRMDPTLSDIDAHNAAAPMINKITGLAQAESGGAIQPNTIGLKNILDYKTALNQSNAVSNLLNGQLPTTLPDISTVATRNILSGLVNDYAPSGISQAVKDYGLLEEGFPSYLKAATAERAPFSITDVALGKELGKYLPPIVKAPIDLTARGVGAAAQNPVGRLALAGAAGAGAAIGLPEIYELP